MTIRASNAIRPDHVIDRACLIQASWPDDTPSFYAVPESDAKKYIAGFRRHGAIASIIEATDWHLQFAWVGIQVAAIGGVGAWCRANIVRI